MNVAAGPKLAAAVTNAGGRELLSRLKYGVIETDTST